MLFGTMNTAAEHIFTPEQEAWLERRFGASRPADRNFDRATIMWIIGGLTALGVAVSGVLYSEIGSLRDEFRGEIAGVRDQVQANTAALARIEAILDERLPRDR